MKKIGIITMHKVLNYGSVLQAYATQYILDELGADSQLIDYIYPNEHHRRKPGLTTKLKAFLFGVRYGFPMTKKRKKFEKFYSENLKLSESQYTSPTALIDNPPTYDTYVSGSDQVWNIDFTNSDPVFFLKFAPKNSNKISYASSFGKVNIKGNPDKFKDSIKELESFSSISVRERNGNNIIKEHLNRDSTICLDPTLLLDKSDWGVLTKKSTIKIEKKYVLVYVLNYVFNPYPYTTEFIDKIAKETGLHVVLLCFGSREKLKTKDATYLHDGVGPNEFLSLFENASLIVTTSFHGTAFALNFEKPFYSILNSEKNTDDRMYSLLQEVGAESQAVKLNTTFPTISTEMDYAIVSDRLSKKREESIEYLRGNI